MDVLLQSHIPGIPCRRGKVRDVYDLGDRLLIVATDRVSAFDVVMPAGIPDKGRVLTRLTLFWLDFLGVPHHLLGTDVRPLGEPLASRAAELDGRSMLVRKTRVVPFECVVRGYLAGSGWKEYQRDGTVCGVALPAGLLQAQQLPEPIFTPATKADSGHDENVSFDVMRNAVGDDLARTLHDNSLAVYRKAAAHAERRGIVLADTKLEWGLTPQGEVLLIDEVLTPDSSRFWPRDEYRPGMSPPSFDKQYLRDWLEVHWDRAGPPPALPPEVVEQTRKRYLEAQERLTGNAS